ncbi:hypothetical protein M405DRAFT_417574 [Rhizopogon salebrosus TDB-379]|nr:hypothetical protein M405DRAFT_417574 [Rhizopogon salebrosus TDB-379]
MLTKRIHDGPRKYDHTAVHDTREPCRSSQERKNYTRPLRSPHPTSTIATSSA